MPRSVTRPLANQDNNGKSLDVQAHKKEILPQAPVLKAMPQKEISKEELWYPVTFAQRKKEQEEEIWLKNNPNASLAEMMYPSMRKKDVPQAVAETPKQAIEQVEQPKQTEKANQTKHADKTISNTAKNQIPEDKIFTEEKSSVAKGEAIVFRANEEADNLNREFAERGENKKSENQGLIKIPHSDNLGAEKLERQEEIQRERELGNSIRRAREFYPARTAEHEVERLVNEEKRQVKLEIQRQEKQKKIEQKQIDEENQLKRTNEFKENAKNSTWGHDFDVLNNDSVEEKGEKALQGAHDSYTIPFQEAFISNIFGSGEVPKNLSPEQKASFENGLIAGTIAKTVGIAIVTKGKVIPTLAAGGGWEMARSLGNQKSIFDSGMDGLNNTGSDLSSSVSDNLAKLLVNFLPTQIRGSAQLGLATTGETFMRSGYEFMQQVIKDPKNATTKNWNKIFDRFYIEVTGGRLFTPQKGR